MNSKCVEQRCGKREIRKTGNAVALQVGENPMNAEAWSADSILTGQWRMAGGLHAMPWSNVRYLRYVYMFRSWEPPCRLLRTLISIVWRWSWSLVPLDNDYCILNCFDVNAYELGPVHFLNGTLNPSQLWLFALRVYFGEQIYDCQSSTEIADVSRHVPQMESKQFTWHSNHSSRHANWKRREIRLHM